MKNIIDEKPTDSLHGRMLFTTEFVRNTEITQKDVLNIGCGYGWFELYAACRNAKKVIGIEPKESDLVTAKKYIVDPKIEFKTACATNLPFPDESFDTVFSWEVIEHIPKGLETRMFEEVHRVLKTNGTFCFSTPYDALISKTFDPAWWLIGHRHYSKKKVVCFAKNSGFKIETVILRGGFWEVFGMLNIYIAKWIFRRRPFFQRFFNNMTDTEYEKDSGFTNVFLRCVKEKQ
jgi:SAM-dependent methyltransferase